MRLYNTLTRQHEEFAPARNNTVRMYTCGLTVYARGHIGNFRTFVCADETVAGPQRGGGSLREYTDRYIAAFYEDAAALGLEPVEEMPRATDSANLEAMAAVIRALERRGHTYVSDGSIYFKISTMPD